MDPEMIFAQKLAGNEKTFRDRALKKLKKWLKTRSVHGSGFTEVDFLKVWKGLFYCMWMSDKPLVQEELAEMISSLVHCFEENTQQGLNFIKCFYLTMGREWFGIDRLRLEKFMMLVRRFLRQNFQFLRKHAWDSTLTSDLASILSSTIVNPTWGPSQGAGATGLQLHFFEIFLEELAKIGGDDLEHQQIWVFLEPFVEQMAKGTDTRLTDHVEERIFQYLMRQSDPGLEYEEQLQGRGQKKSNRKGVSGAKKAAPDMEKVKDDDEMEGMMMEPLDPRAGNVNVTLPQLQVDYVDLSTHLLNAVTDNMPPRNRKQLFRLVRQFRDLAGGIYPLAVRIMKVPSRHESRKVFNAAVQRRIRFEEEWKKTLEKEKEGEMPTEDEIAEREREAKEAFKLAQKMLRKKNRRIKKRKLSAERNTSSGNDTGTPPKKKRKTKHQETQNGAGVREETRSVGAEENDLERPEINVKRKRKKNTAQILENGFTVETHAEEAVKEVGNGIDVEEKTQPPGSADDLESPETTVKKKRKKNVFLVPADGFTVETQPEHICSQNEDIEATNKEPKSIPLPKKITNAMDVKTDDGVFLKSVKSPPVFLERAKKKCIARKNSSCGKLNSLTYPAVNTENGLDHQAQSLMVNERGNEIDESTLKKNKKQNMEQNGCASEAIMSHVSPQTAETEVIITTPKRVLLKKSKMANSLKTPSPTFLKKAKLKLSTPGVNPVVKAEIDERLSMSAPPAMKKVNFVLSRNMSQEHRDYKTSVENSPGIPYDATRKPIQGVLKATPCNRSPFLKKRRSAAAEFF